MPVGPGGKAAAKPHVRQDTGVDVPTQRPIPHAGVEGAGPGAAISSHSSELTTRVIGGISYNFNREGLARYNADSLIDTDCYVRKMYQHERTNWDMVQRFSAEKANRLNQHKMQQSQAAQQPSNQAIRKERLKELHKANIKSDAQEVWTLTKRMSYSKVTKKRRRHQKQQ